MEINSNKFCEFSRHRYNGVLVMQTVAGSLPCGECTDRVLCSLTVHGQRLVKMLKADRQLLLTLLFTDPVPTPGAIRCLFPLRLTVFTVFRLHNHVTNKTKYSYQTYVQGC